MTTPVQENPINLQPQKSHRNRTVRNVIIGIVVAVVALPLLIIGLLWSGLIFQEQQWVSVGDASTAAGRYYQAVQRQDYTTAYTYVQQHATLTIDGRAVTVDSADELAAVSGALDQKYGDVKAYTLTDGMFEQGKNVVDMTIHVTRASRAYDVHVQMIWLGGDQLFVNKDNWKILQADGI